MASISVVLLLGLLAMLAAVLFVGGGTLIYYLIYKKTINKRLEAGVTNKRKMMSPFWMPLILLAVLCIVGLPLLLIVLPFFLIANVTTNSVVSDMESVDVKYVEEYTEPSTSMAIYTAKEMRIGFLSMFSMEENPGYEKQTYAEGNVQFTCFIAEEEPSLYQPLFLAYAEISDQIPEDAVIVVESSLGISDGFQHDCVYTCGMEDIPSCLMGYIETPVPEENCIFTLSCTILEPGSESYAEMYMLDGEAIPEELILEESTPVEFMFTSAE